MQCRQRYSRDMEKKRNKQTSKERESSIACPYGPPFLFSLCVYYANYFPFSLMSIIPTNSVSHCATLGSCNISLSPSSNAYSLPFVLNLIFLERRCHFLRTDFNLEMASHPSIRHKTLASHANLPSPDTLLLSCRS